MSGINYEIQSRNLKSYKHTFDYEVCRKKYLHYALMNLEDFKNCLRYRNKLGEIGHLCCFILWVKNKPGYKYRDSLGDYGLIHLLWHCVESEIGAVEMHAEYIHKLFKEDIELV